MHRITILIGLCCLLIYNLNGRAISAGDTYPARYQPFAIVGHHSLLLDSIATLTAQGRGGAAYWMLPVRGGHIISLYPIVQPVLIAPLYVPAVAYLNWQGWSDTRLDHLARVMEKITASLIASLSAALLFVLLRRRTDTRIALLLTIAYAFGTTTWVISSQALWQHGIAQLLIIGLLLLLTSPCTTRRALAAGLLCGLIAGNRPPDTVLAMVLGAYGLFWAGRRAVVMIGAAAVPMGLVLLYNLALTGNVGGGYGLVGKPTYFQHELLAGLGGLLISPTRGLFVFSPFLLFLLVAWRHWPRDRAERGLTVAMIVGIAIQLVVYAKADWRGGLSWGPRYMTDLLPLLIWMLVPVVASLRGFGRVAFASTVAIAIAIEAVGAFCYNWTTDLPIFAVDSGPRKMQAAWDWRNAPFITSWQHGRAPAELLTMMRGAVDSIDVGGQEIVASGWALAGQATPYQVAVVIDGKQTIASQTFADRPDVRGSVPQAGPSGWRIPIRTTDLAPGEHHLTAYVWASARGESYFLAQRTLTVQSAATADVVDPELRESFQTAAARIRTHQQAPGYWLTAFTNATRFQDPHPEMNTYLTAVLIDLLEPLATATGLGDSVQRARQHLTGQIEANGLVRYHGRPDAPTIGTLGCAITPDSDDTALAWRIAPDRDSARLSAALATIAQYRTNEGLYRTWLAPREAYQCLDPGTDPNPTDIAIQIHVLQLLAKAQPPADRALCDILGRVIDQDRIWVYYRLTPLVPILRLTDLQRVGCTLDLPESRMRTTVAGQDIWISVVRALARVPPGDAVAVKSVLRQLAKDDFALLRQNPPLLYHNDLSATVPRYYWSEDVGYALWLRLAIDYAHVGHSGLAE